MNNFLTSLLNYLTPAAIAALLCAVIALTTYAYQRALQALPSNLRVQVQSLAETIVQAIEQKYRCTEGESNFKKQEALEQMQQIASSLGLKLDHAHASAAIEAAVYSMNRANALAHNEPEARFDTQMLPVVRKTDQA